MADKLPDESDSESLEDQDELISVAGGAPIYLSDIAEVKTFAQWKSGFRQDWLPAIWDPVQRKYVNQIKEPLSRKLLEPDKEWDEYLCCLSEEESKDLICSLRGFLTERFSKLHTSMINPTGFVMQIPFPTTQPSFPDPWTSSQRNHYPPLTQDQKDQRKEAFVAHTPKSSSIVIPMERKPFIPGRTLKYVI